MGTIALLTDFGDSGGFVGMIKGTIRKLASETVVIDMTHSVASFDVKAAAFLLQRSYHYYPEGTVFLAVVDPGVGSSRKIIAAKAGKYSFVAPDNGVLSYLLAEFDDREVVSVENSLYFQQPVSRTFQGRDIMAPVAASLSKGIDLHQFGSPLTSYIYLKTPNLLKHHDHVIGEVVFVDKFGNMISNIRREDLPSERESSSLSCTVDDQKNIRFVNSYSEGTGLSVILSGLGTVEIFLREGNASAQFKNPIGTVVAVEG